jgi:hypothetical protein
MEWLYKGNLKKIGEQSLRPYGVRTLYSGDLPEILRVQDVVFDQLEKKEILQPLTREEFLYILEGKGLMIGAFDGDQLIAFRALLVPPIDEEHLGLDIGLREEQLPEVIYQEISNVLPAYRGNGLQKTLAKVIMGELTKGNHPYRYICCTVAPFNIPSLKDKFAQGMHIAALKAKYGGLLRYVFVKDLAEEDVPQWQEVVSVKMADTAAQQELLQKGWCGFRLDEEKMSIQYRH